MMMAAMMMAVAMMTVAVAMMTVGETTMAERLMTTVVRLLTTTPQETTTATRPMTATQTQPAAISPPAMTALMGRVPAPQMLAQEVPLQMRLAGRKEQLPRAVVVRLTQGLALAQVQEPSLAK
jgi:hypothetical protein